MSPPYLTLATSPASSASSPPPTWPRKLKCSVCRKCALDRDMHTVVTLVPTPGHLYTLLVSSLSPAPVSALSAPPPPSPHQVLPGGGTTCGYGPPPPGTKMCNVNSFYSGQ